MCSPPKYTLTNQIHSYQRIVIGRIISEMAACLWASSCPEQTYQAQSYHRAFVLPVLSASNSGVCAQISPSQRLTLTPPPPLQLKEPVTTSKTFYDVLCCLLFSVTMEIRIPYFFGFLWILIFRCLSIFQFPLEHKLHGIRDLSIFFASVLPRPCRGSKASTPQIMNERMKWTNIYWLKITESSWNLIIFCFQYIYICSSIWVKWYWFSPRAGIDKPFFANVSW